MYMENHLYNYGKIGHFWVKGYEYLRNTLVKVVNDNYIDKLSLIKCPTILLWGEYDTETPISDGMIMNKYIKDSALITIKNANHFPLSTNYMECLLIIDSFLRS